ncbi:hypothetical protein FACS1894105_08850 [Clostridia bacterium]|nr:hypothetical protein FACS1894105_08850 [Clostridia bacterium]
MWWYIEKLSDENGKIIYSYGYESYDQTGKVEYNQSLNECKVIKPADGDGGYGLKRFLGHLKRVITSENAPAKRMIATG